MILKDYLDRRVREHRLKPHSQAIKKKQESFEEIIKKDAHDVWTSIKKGFVTRQDSNMEETITIKLTAFPDGYFYYADKKYYKKPEGKNITFRESTLKLIMEIAAEEGIIVDRKENQCIVICDELHMLCYYEKEVYEFIYNPPSD